MLDKIHAVHDKHVIYKSYIIILQVGYSCKTKQTKIELLHTKHTVFISYMGAIFFLKCQSYINKRAVRVYTVDLSSMSLKDGFTNFLKTKVRCPN